MTTVVGSAANSASKSITGDCVRGARQIVYVALAGLFLVLGLVGIVLPGLPTTPFLLLTSYFLSRSWPRMNRLLLGSKVLGPILRDWNQHRGVRPRVKIQAFVVVVAALTATVAFADLPANILAIVLIAGLSGLVVIHRLPTVTSKSA